MPGADTYVANLNAQLASGKIVDANGNTVPAPGYNATSTAQTGAQTLAADQMSAYSSDVQTAQNSAQGMSSIFELGAAARGFTPGPLAAQLANVNSIAAELKLPLATDETTAEQTAAKAAGMLLADNLTGFGTSSDAKLGAAMGITPNGSMSAGGLAATAAMTAGAKLYKMRLGQAAQTWEAQGGNPTDPSVGYSTFKLAFQREASPLVMALPFMPPDQIKELQSYVKTLPKDQQILLNNQVKFAKSQGWLDPAPAQ
jgi:hypothetical protein